MIRKHPKQKVSSGYSRTTSELHAGKHILAFILVEQNTISFSPNYSKLAILPFSSCCKTSGNEQGQERLEVNFLFKAVNSARYLKMYSTLSMNSCIDFSKIIHM